MNEHTIEQLNRDKEDDAESERRIDLWHQGWFTRYYGRPLPKDPIMREGWKDCEHSLQVHVVMPERPEGYYHQAPEPIEEPPFDYFADVVEPADRWRERGQ